jgi:hypothetical protein
MTTDKTYFWKSIVCILYAGCVDLIWFPSRVGLDKRERKTRRRREKRERGKGLHEWEDEGDQQWGWWVHRQNKRVMQNEEVG